MELQMIKIAKFQAVDQDQDLVLAVRLFGLQCLYYCSVAMEVALEVLAILETVVNANAAVEEEDIREEIVVIAVMMIIVVVTGHL